MEVMGLGSLDSKSVLAFTRGGLGPMKEKDRIRKVRKAVKKAVWQGSNMLLLFVMFFWLWQLLIFLVK